MAARSSGTPWLGGYWLRPATMASAAICASSGGPSVSGKPWPRLRDPVASARSDMAAKIVVVKGRSRSTSSFVPLVRHPHDGTGALWSGRIVLTVANFNLHAGVDGWGRPFDTIAVCRELGADVIALEESLDQQRSRRRRRGRASRADRRRPGLRGVHVHIGRRPAGPTRPRRHRQVDVTPGSAGRQERALLRQRAVLFRPCRRGSPRFTAAEPGSWGIAVLVRRGITVDGSRILHLPQLGRDRVRRAAIVVDLTVDDHQISVIGTHMSHLQFGSHRHYAALQEAPAHRRPGPMRSCWAT